MSYLTITTNATEVAGKLDRLNREIKLQLPALYRQLGPRLVKDVQDRIRSQDDGKWATMSKWTKAQRNPSRLLEDTEKYIKWKMVGNTAMAVYGDMPGDWTFSQHQEGFENKEDKREGDRVVIDVLNPGPLGLGAVPDGKFSWVPKRGAGRTPARKIWTSDEEARVIILPIGARWLEALVKRTAEGPL